MSLNTSIEKIRDELADIRRRLHVLGQNTSEIGYTDGALTCLIAALHGSQRAIIKDEIEQDNREFGPSLPFAPRGIGLDVCPGCFVCGGEEHADGFLNNIAAFVNSKENGETIVKWFGELARLDFRPSEPNWIQVKVGACDKHLLNLKKLEELTFEYRVIRESHIRLARGI